MKIMLVGGGSGGHITPLLAVAHEVKSLRPRAQVCVITDKYNSFHSLLKTENDINDVYFVTAGKLRRYQNQTFIRKLTDVNTMVLNMRDVLRTTTGVKQAHSILKKVKPDIIFIKGGFVGVPVGIAARRLGIPYVTHDSDTMPGLANRLIAKGALLHAVGMPEQFYSYPKKKTRYVGIPLSTNYQHVTPRINKQFRTELSIKLDAKVVLITGGSQGAERLNSIVASVLPLLSKQGVVIIHQTGKTVTGTTGKDYQQFKFSNELFKYSAIADVVVARAGASTIAELAVQGKAVILVPSPYLAGGHQLSNAHHLAKHGAAVELEEMQLLQQPEKLYEEIMAIMADSTQRSQLESNISKLARPHAARTIASLLVSQA